MFETWVLTPCNKQGVDGGNIETKDFERNHEIACSGYFTEDKFEEEKKPGTLLLKSLTQG